MTSSFALVTGAAGFIGSRLTQKLLEQGVNVVAADCFLPDLYSPEAKRKRWDSLPTNSRGELMKIEFDLRTDDFHRFDKYAINSVFNEAAMPGLSTDWEKFSPYYECNLSALNRLLEYSKSLQLKSFVHASTSSVYGKNAIGYESQDLNPTSPYGVSKLAAEKLLLAYFEWFSVPIKILRYFSVYGPNQRPDMAYAKIIDCVLNDKEFTIYGDGEQRRSNTYIDDVIDATILAESKGKPGDVMNVCGSDTISLNEVISLIEEFSGKRLQTRKADGRKGDQRETSGSNAFALARLGWTTKVDFREGIKRQFEAALEQKSVEFRNQEFRGIPE